jgi:hypothetical protein
MMALAITSNSVALGKRRGGDWKARANLTLLRALIMQGKNCVRHQYLTYLPFSRCR